MDRAETVSIETTREEWFDDDLRSMARGDGGVLGWPHRPAHADAALGVSTMAVMAALRGIPVSAQAAAPQPTGPRPDGTPAPDDQQVLRMVTPSPYRMDPLTYGGDLWQMQMLVFQALTRVDADGTLVSPHRPPPSRQSRAPTTWWC